MRNKILLSKIVLALTIPFFLVSCKSDDDNNEKPISSDIGKDHTYSFSVVGGETYSGTIPNLDAVSVYSTYPEADILMTTFFNDDVSFNCNYAIVDSTILDLNFFDGNAGETSGMAISVGDGAIGYYSVSGSVAISNLTLQFTTGNTSWAVYTIHFTGLFADGADETANIFEITGTYTIYPEEE